MKTTEEISRLFATFLGHDKKDNDVTWTAPSYLSGKFWVDEHFFNGTDDYSGRRQTDISEMKFHTSWEWLMLVIEKVEELDFCTITISTRATTIFYKGSKFNAISGNTKLELTYNTLADFIEWYNKYKVTL